MNQEESNQFFTLEGKIQALRLAPGVVNLLKDIQNGSIFTGVIESFGMEPSAMTNSASLVMYDGEDVEHLALLVNDQFAVGTFEWLSDLKVGDDVMLVVSKIDDGPLFVHAILRKQDQLLWTPISVDHTRRGWIIHALKIGFLLLAFTWLGAAFCYLTINSFLTSMDLVIIFLLPPLLIGFIMFMSARDLMSLGQQAEEIFRALDVPKLKKFRLKPYSLCNLHFLSDPDSLKKGHIFNFSKALAAHKERFNLTS